jgi:hypothetical protein
MQVYVENLHTREPPRRERLHARDGKGETSKGLRLLRIEREEGILFI